MSMPIKPTTPTSLLPAAPFFVAVALGVDDVADAVLDVLLDVLLAEADPDVSCPSGALLSSLGSNLIDRFCSRAPLLE